MKHVFAAVGLGLLAGCAGSSLISVKDPDAIVTPAASGVWLSLEEIVAKCQVLSDGSQGKQVRVKLPAGLVMYYPSSEELKELIGTNTEIR